MDHDAIHVVTIAFIALCRRDPRELRHATEDHVVRMDERELKLARRVGDVMAELAARELTRRRQG